MESLWEEVMRRNRQAKIIFKMSHCMGDGDISVKKTGFILIYSHSFLLDAAEIVEIMKWIINQKYCNESVYRMYGNPTVCTNTWVWCVHTQGEIFNELVGNQIAYVNVHMGILAQMLKVLYYLCRISCRCTQYLHSSAIIRSPPSSLAVTVFLRRVALI